MPASGTAPPALKSPLACRPHKSPPACRAHPAREAGAARGAPTRAESLRPPGGAAADRVLLGALRPQEPVAHGRARGGARPHAPHRWRLDRHDARGAALGWGRAALHYLILDLTHYPNIPTLIQCASPMARGRKRCPEVPPWIGAAAWATRERALLAACSHPRASYPLPLLAGSRCWSVARPGLHPSPVKRVPADRECGACACLRCLIAV